MRTNRLTRLRHWPSAVYTEHLSARWRATHPAAPTREVELPIASALGAGTGSAALRIAVVCHAFYPDLLGELIDVLVNLPPGFDLYVSIVGEEHRQVVTEHLQQLPTGVLDVRTVPNRGRDIAPKYVTFRDVYDGGCDLVLFLHTKKTTSTSIGPGWRQHLLAETAGSRDRVDGIIRLFEREPRLGVLAPSHHGSVAANTGWHGSYPAAAALGRRAGFEVRRWSPPDFASGSMFWARPGALRPLTAIGLRLDDFPPEAGQNAYTVMHALERLVFVSAATAGFDSAFVGSARPSAPTPAGRRNEAAPEEPAAPPLAMWLGAVPGTMTEITREVLQRRAKLRPARVRAWLSRQAARIGSRAPAP